MTSRALGLHDLARRAEHTKNAYVRLTLADGDSIEGDLLRVASNAVVLVDRITGEAVDLPADEVSAIDIRTPRRGREWLLAIATIIGATVALVLYASLPWIRPERDVVNGFMVLYTAAGALLPWLLARTRLGEWLNEWRRLYPPSGA